MIRCWQSVVLLFLFEITPSLAMADPLCWLRTTSPLDMKLQGPLDLGTDWKTYKLTRPFKVSPHVYEIQLLLSRSDFEFVESFNRMVPRNVRTGRVQLFDVKVRNSMLGWVNLMYSSTAYPPDKNHGFLAIGFTNHPDKNQYFYPQGSVIDEVQIRANQKVVVEEIRWQADGYWKWPCRKWFEVPASEIMVPQR